MNSPPSAGYGEEEPNTEKLGPSLGAGSFSNRYTFSVLVLFDISI